MAHESLTNDDWDWTVERLGGVSLITMLARETKAFVRARGIGSAIDLLRLTLSYCLGHVGLRGTAAWAEAMGLASVSDVALLGRFRNTTEWLSRLIGQVLRWTRPWKNWATICAFRRGWNPHVRRSKKFCQPSKFRLSNEGGARFCSRIRAR